MSMTDPLADMIVRINNGQTVGKNEVRMPGSKLKKAVAMVLESEGYISGYSVSKEASKAVITIKLKYYKDIPVISRFERISKPGRRVYVSSDRIPKVIGGLGVSIISTSQGLMTDRMARSIGQGGEVLCLVS